MIGQERPSCAADTDLKGAIAIGLDECTTALEEALTGLTDEQVWGFPLPERHNITTIAVHCIENWNEYGLAAQGAESVVTHDNRFDMWGQSPREARPLQTDLPTVEEILSTLRAVRDAMKKALGELSVDDLRSRPGGHWWYDDESHVRADAYMRTIMHCMGHVRQIWMLRGVMGLTDEQGWPLQHWA